MDNEPSLLARIYEFGLALLPYWWLWVTGGILAFEPMLELILSKRKKRALNARFSKEIRRRFALTISVILLLVASFLAFDDVNTRNRALQREVTKITGERDKAIKNFNAVRTNKRDRSAIRKKLMEFYAEAESLARGGGVKGDRDYDKYKDRVAEWRKRVHVWLDKNVGPTAGSRFEEYQSQIAQGLVSYTNAIHPEHNWYMNYVGYLRTNLLKIIESDAWDKP